MSTKRIIGKIDIKGSKVIKGIRFEGLRIIEELEEFLFLRKDDLIVDEIYINNITGSLYDTHFDLSLLEKICKNIHIPVTVQGGITSLKEIEKLLEKGASRVALNSPILKNTLSIDSLFKEFGSQAIVFSPSIRVDDKGEINFFINAGRELIRPEGNLNAYEYLKILCDKGLIEVLLRLIDFDGVNKNIDHKTLRILSEFNKLNIDTIVSGSMHIESNYMNSLNYGVQGIALSSFYIYHFNNIQKVRSEISKKWEVRK